MRGEYCRDTLAYLIMEFIKYKSFFPANQIKEFLKSINDIKTNVRNLRDHLRMQGQHHDFFSPGDK